MTPGITKRFFPISVPIGVAILLMAASAGAQSTTTQENAPQAQAANAQIATTPAPAPYWASIGGFEGDTHKTGYGFFGPAYVHPIRDKMAVTASFNANYLFYEYDNGRGTTAVRSPGAGARVGLQFGEHNHWGVNAGPSFKRQHRIDTLRDGTIVSSTKVRPGLGIGADLYANPMSHNNVQGLITHSTDDKYTWGRLGFKEQLSNRNWSKKYAHFLGAEFIGQGNHDITSQQFGGFVEVTHVPSTVSVMFRAGYKNSSFKVGPDKSGPYFAVGFYQRVK